ncbi:hypothetical protein BKA70DRAFT_1255279, partial [Coprinopsis sp. MPI-PUGE-AT-0042]
NLSPSLAIHTTAMEDPLQRPATRSTGMSMVSETGLVSVANSNLSMVGGHATHVAVNIALNNEAPKSPPITRSRWLQLLGKWLAGPEAASPPSLSASSPPEVEPTSVSESPTMGDRASPALNSEHGTNGGVSSHKTCSDIEITSLDYLDIQERLALTSPPVRMPHEIYVRQLYPRGHGYPCANPKPYGDPVQIGDIGLLESDGFNVLQNLSTLPEAFLRGNPVPQVPTVYDPEVCEPLSGQNDRRPNECSPGVYMHRGKKMITRQVTASPGVATLSQTVFLPPLSHVLKPLVVSPSIPSQLRQHAQATTPPT